MRYSSHFCTLRTELKADAASMLLCFTDSKIQRLLSSLHRAKGITSTRMIRGRTISNTCTFCQQIFLEAWTVTGRSASCFGEEYRDLLLYLNQKLDENNSNQQVRTGVQQYIQYTILRSHVASNSVLFAESGDTTSAARQQGEELLGETYGRRNRRRNVYASLEM